MEQDSSTHSKYLARAQGGTVPKEKEVHLCPGEGKIAMLTKLTDAHCLWTHCVCQLSAVSMHTYMGGGGGVQLEPRCIHSRSLTDLEACRGARSPGGYLCDRRITKDLVPAI